MESKGAISSTFPEKKVRMNGQIFCYLVCFDFRRVSKLDIPSSVKSQLNLIQYTFALVGQIGLLGQYVLKISTILLLCRP